MTHAIDPLLVLVLLLNFLLLGSTRLRGVIQVSALQGVILGVLIVLVHRSLSLESVLVAAGTLLIKGLFIPSMLLRAMRDTRVRRELDPIIGSVPSLLLGGVGTALSVAYARTLPLAPAQASSLLVPASMATALTGFIVLTTRRKAVTLAAGYLVLENGIFILGIALVEAMPFLVEIGVLLDLLVGVFVMGIIISHMRREFASLDSQHISRLRE